MPDVFHLHREMGCTRAEFMSWLPGATRHAPFQIDGDLVTVVTDRGRVQISLEEKPPRRIGLIALPVLGVRFLALRISLASFNSLFFTPPSPPLLSPLLAWVREFSRPLQIMENGTDMIPGFPDIYLV